MADKDRSGIEENEQVASSAVVSTTTNTVSDADKSSAPGPYHPDHGGPKLNDPPLRTNRPDVPIAHALSAGAGEHTPPSSDEVQFDGRPVYDEAEASQADPANPDAVNSMSDAAQKSADQAGAQGGDQADTQRQPAAGRRGR